MAARFWPSLAQGSTAHYAGYAYVFLLLTASDSWGLGLPFSLVNLAWGAWLLAGYPGFCRAGHRLMTPAQGTFCFWGGGLLMALVFAGLASGQRLGVLAAGEWRALLKVALIAPLLLHLAATNWQRLVRVVIFSQSVLAVWLLIQVVLFAQIDQRTGRPNVMVGGRDTNFVAGFLAVTWPYLLGQFHGCLSPAARNGRMILGLALTLAAMALSGAAVIIMESRLAFLTMAAGTAVAMVSWQWPGRLRALMVVGSSLGITALLTMGTGLAARLMHLQDTSNTDRIKTLIAGGKAFLASPIWGHGLGTTGPWYYALSGYGSWEAGASDLRAHNSFVLMAADNGILGLLPYAAMWLVFAGALLTARSTPRTKGIALVAGLILAAQAMVMPLAYSDWFYFYMLLLLGLNRPKSQAVSSLRTAPLMALRPKTNAR